MTALSVGAALALAAACQNVVAPITMVGIARHESGLEQFAIHDNEDNRTYAPATKSEAARLAHQLMGAGHRSLDLGLTQINTANNSWLGLTTETALDPCKNIAAGAQVLTAYSLYNTGSETKGIANGYALKVNAAVSDPCMIARYNGNGTDPVKAAYAASVLARVNTVPAAPAMPPARPNPFTWPERIGQAVVFLSASQK